jgi:hypothetical protein
MRRSEADLVERVRRDIDPGIFDAAFFAGSRLDRREAVALVRGYLWAGTADPTAPKVSP